MKGTDPEPQRAMITDVGSDYSSLRRLLFGALARLAREGFQVPPADAADLVHDFFIETWPAVVRGYDPHKGRLEAYAYRAFVYFARPRIVKLRRWRGCLTETAQLARIVPAPVREAESARDIAAVSNALSKLPPLHRDVLRGYLVGDLRSERALSEAFGLSRYRLRETLVEAMGRVAVLLGEPGRITERDWEVARALWQGGHSVAEAAAHLGRTVEQVRTARERIGQILSESLRAWQPTIHLPERTKVMPRDIRSLLNEVLSSPGKTHLLKEVKSHADEILDYLERAESLEEWDKLSLEVDRDWLAEVYSAIAGDELLLPEEVATMEAMLQATRSEESSIGYAFKEALLRDLPERVANLENWFKDLPQINENELKELYDTPAVQAALPQAESLVVFGVTPLTVFYATEAVGSLVDRLVRHGFVKLNEALVLEEQDRPAPLPGSPRSQATTPAPVVGSVLLHWIIRDEIMKMAECNRLTAAALLSWLVVVAQSKPFVFRGLEAEALEAEAVEEAEAEAVEKAVKLRRDRGTASAESLDVRWGLTTGTASLAY